MRAFLFAETRGKRMGSLTKNTPKPMLLVNGKPILQHSIEAIRDGGIKEIVISVFFHKEVIENFFGNGSKYGVTINYLKPAKVNGMAFSLYNSWNLIPDDHFLVVQGDIIFGPQLIRGWPNFRLDEGTRYP